MKTNALPASVNLPINSNHLNTIPKPVNFLFERINTLFEPDGPYFNSFELTNTLLKAANSLSTHLYILPVITLLPISLVPINTLFGPLKIIFQAINTQPNL